MKRVVFSAGLMLLAAAAFAQTAPPEVSFSENFQSYKTQANPPGWIDSSVGNPRPEAAGLYKTWPDPTEAKAGVNVVYGTKQASGKPEGRNPRIGTFSTLSTLSFSGQGRFEYRGRILRTSADSRIGLSFFSSYPELDQYYLVGLWSPLSGTGLTMQLFGFGAGAITGTVDSGQSIDPDRWYRFLIQVDDVNDETRIRARFWPDGTAEPETFSIEAVDDGATRLRSGRIGLWAAVKGEAYFDDIAAKSPVDHTPPTITLLESGNPLPDGSKFNRDAVPEIQVTDDLSAFTYTATLDGLPYTSLTPVPVEGWHTLLVTAVDGPGNVSTLQVKFLVDKTPPVVLIREGTNPFPPGFYFNRDVIAGALVTDVSQTAIAATLDGAPYLLGTAITTEGNHSIAVTATDEVGWSTTAGPIEFVIDKTAPVITFTSHANDQLLSIARATLTGGSDDAVTMTVGGAAAVVAANGFTSAELALLEGENTIAATAVDRAGNIGTATLRLIVDTRGPAVAFTSPNAAACLDTSTLQVTGTAADARLDSVKVTIGTTAVDATFDATGNWTASIPVPEEGKKLITVEATDKAGHSISASRTVVIDRTAPAIEVRANGQAFTSTITNRPVALFVTATDADPNVTTTITLDGAPYVAGTSVTAEGKHVVAVTSTDCAGHTSEKSVEFTLDLTPPTIRSFNPPDGGIVGTMPVSLAAVTDPDVATVVVSDTALSATPAADGSFTIPAVPFAEGLNRFTLVATDRAGNSSTVPYTVTIRTVAPIVEIRESGLEIPAGALFNRPITPTLRAVDLQATVSATLNGSPFPSGTTITADGDYTLRATATDSLGHIGTAEATFTIDRTPPVVKITSPATGIVQADRVEVRGNAGDSVSATVNGQPVTLAADGSFIVESVLLDVGENTISATGRDRAGNNGRDDVVVTRDDLSAGILLTYPPDRSRTNRPAIDVIGRLLTPNRGTVVRIGTTDVPVDSTGAFRLNAYQLIEGENTITATATATNGRETSASTRVTVDLTPPALTILESEQPLTEGARFAERAVISLQASDAAGAVTTELTIDGSPVSTAPFTVTSTGGHSAIAIARDLAGNETRAERTFFVGTAGGGAAGCALTGFDPADGAVVLSNTVTLTGRSGGAIGVKVNGVPAVVADGAFLATMELSSEGPNLITIVCTDGDGNPTGTQATMTMQRVTGDPSVSIDTPAEDFVSGQESIGVTGTVGAGVVSADVNGVAATINGADSSVPRSFSVAGVRLADGLNVLVARGRNAAGRAATASRRGLYIKDAPAVSITSPAANTTTGSPGISISGTWSDLDPATLALGSGAPVQFTRSSDTAGTFVADGVPLNNGSQTITVTGRDRLNRMATSSVAVTLVSGAPGITISQPANHASFGGGSTSVTVSGNFQAASGSIVDVNGVTAELTGASYSASVPFSTLPGGITPIVARVTEPSGTSASASIAVTQYADAPRVIESFPPPDAAQVDSGALVLVLFSQPMDVATAGAAFRLEDGSGAPVSGTPFLDKDVLTFAPATLLQPGGRYTLRVGTAATNLAGTPLAAAYSAAFTVTSTAPATPPSLTPLSSAVCGQSITIAGSTTPAARVRLESGTLILNAVADASGAFSFTYPISGQSGFALARVRVVGADGSVSPAAELEIRIDCSGPQVLNASYDRTVNKLTVQFSEPIDPASATVGSGNAIVLTLDDGSTTAATAAVSGSVVILTPAVDLTAKSFSLTITTAIQDVLGNRLVAPFSHAFAVGGEQPVAGDGSGFISGEVYDATTGRPLPGAAINIDVAAGSPVTTAADARGRYLVRLREGAHTIQASLAGYTTVWREIIVPPGAGVVPIDIRLTRRGEAQTSNGSPMALTHGGDTAVTGAIDLSVSQLDSGRTITLTAVGGQALMGLLPLGWSPLGSAEIAIDASDAAAPLSAQLTFNVPSGAITAAAQNLTAVQFNAARDEWTVVTPVVNVPADGRVTLPITMSGAYALVYADKTGPPPLPVAGDVLRGVRAPEPAALALVKRDFTLDPPIVLPSGRAVATLRIEGAAEFPSGTAVQAYIDEELRLADGSRLLEPPFATDLLLYRTLDGELGIAAFHLAPSERATQVVLETGVERIRVFPYPGRLDRGTLIGSEGGRVPADDRVSVDIPAGAVPEPLRATATALTASDLTAIGTVAGFRVVGGFHLTLQRATEAPPVDFDGDGVPDPLGPPELFVPARVTFTADASQMPGANAQVILAELLDVTPYGRMMRLAVPMVLVDGSQVRFTTASIDRSVLPVDGVMREGRYALLAAEAPIAFATGTVRLLGPNGRLLGDARVLDNVLGVAELTRQNGIYNIPVPARPAAPFTLTPRHTTTGQGASYTHAAQVDPAAVVRVDLALVPQPPVLGSVVVLKGEPPSQAALGAGTVTRDVALTTNIRASFTPAIDPASVTADSIRVTDALTGARVSGSAAADGTVAVVWTLTAGERLKPNGRYIVEIAASIRGANGTTLSSAATFSFATITQILNTEVNRDRIRISIPDANGFARITAVAGALPAGWQAVAVRRNIDFNERYQATAANDGSFSFMIGNGPLASDRITIADLIDLQVINSAGNVAAIFPLTPFTSEDGKSFVAPAGAAVRFTTPEGFTLEVPEGAFDVATVISMTGTTKQAFLDIPSLEQENEYFGSVQIDFEGEAKKPLKFEAPVPSGFDPAGRTLILAEKYMSSVGPRLVMVDLLKVENGKFVSDGQPAVNAVVIGKGLQQRTTQTLVGSQFVKYLNYVRRSGAYMYLDIKVYGIGGAVGFAVMEGLQANYDLMWDIYFSYIIPHVQVYERGGAILPIITGRPFTVTGIDPGTGLQAFRRTYDPVPFGEPGTVTPIASAEENDGGPYPVFGGPFRVEMLDLDVEEVDVRSIRNFIIRLQNGTVTVSQGIPAEPPTTAIELLNVSKGTKVSGNAGTVLTTGADLGDRIVLLIEQNEVDPDSPISIVFNEPIVTGESDEPDAVDEFLRNLFKVEHAPNPGNGEPYFSDITPQVRFETDSGDRRVNIRLPSALQSEARYRITLKGTITDITTDGPGLKLGTGTIEVNGNRVAVGGGSDLVLQFDVRKPAGVLNTFTALSVGLVRGMELAGNVLLVAGTNAGLLGFDMSNPTVAQPPQLAMVPGPPTAVEHLSVHVDRHNRVYSTAQQPIAGVFRSYRVEDFADGGDVKIWGSTIISWKIGYSQSIGLPSNTVVSDRPESLPWRIKVILQDDEETFENRDEFIAAGGSPGPLFPDDIQQLTFTTGNDSQYAVQRITVENLTLDMKWSGDATDSGPAVISNIIARKTDRMRLIRNLKTYAIVAHLGYGVGIYDANAIESNRQLGLGPTSPGRIQEQLVLTAGKIDRNCLNGTPDYGIVEGYLPTDVELNGTDSGKLYALSTDPHRGVLDLDITLPSNTHAGTYDDDCVQRPSPNTGGLLLRTSPPGFEAERMVALRGAIGNPIIHFSNLARFTWSVSAADNLKGLRGTEQGRAAQREYMLVSGHGLGLIVVDIGSNPVIIPPFPLRNENIADVIWIPGGAVSARVYQSANVAVVLDRAGRALVVDLSRIDERWDEKGNWVDGLFPTVRKALGSPGNDPYGPGADDPRILWKSPPGVGGGSVPPVFDPYTGMLYAGNFQKVSVMAALDPKVRVKVNLGEQTGLADVGGIVPLGIEPPQNIQDIIDSAPACVEQELACKDNGSLGVFRIEVALPGNMTDALTLSSNELRLALESERVAGAITEQTPAGFPRAHLRRTRRDGSAEAEGRAASNFKFKRIVPDALAGALRHQRGYNRFVSPWIVAIADPRASEEYDWRGATLQEKKEAGCYQCERPKHLKGKTEQDGIYELYTNGRFVTVRPELIGGGTIFDGTQYTYLGQNKRMLGSFVTIMADTVRPTEVLVAGQNAPVANGALQQTTFLHSGELSATTVDLDAGGRAGFNVTFDRTYRARTLGGSVFGQGWDSSLLRRLRALPNGDVEYRDGAEVWRFRIKDGSYESPKGLFLKLSRTANGWTIVDQSWRVTDFDDLGRIVSHADEFFEPSVPDSGNIIRFVYDEAGLLSEIVDPVRRSSRLQYWKESEAGAEGAYPGVLKEIVDWRERKLNFHYDATAGTLTRVKLPEVANSTGSRPTVEYAYSAGGSSYSDRLELRSNLESIRDPQHVAAGGAPRVRFTYSTGGGFLRDRVIAQQWGTDESASFTYESPTSVTTIDVFGQSRKYTLTEPPKNYFDDRQHVLSAIEGGVTVSSTPLGELPTAVTAAQPATTSTDRTVTFAYDAEGLVTTETLSGVRSIEYTYKDVRRAAPGFVLLSATKKPLAGSAAQITEALTYQSGPNLSTFVSGMTANGLAVEAPEASRKQLDVASSNNSINETETFDINGLLTELVSSGGTDSAGSGTSASAEFAGTTAAKHERARITKVDEGGLATEISYPGPDRSIETDGRGVVTSTDYDTWDRPVHITVAGTGVNVDERFEYDATGRLVKHVRKQGEADVTKTYDYDVMGRPTRLTLDNVADSGMLTRTIEYNIPGRTIVTRHPGGAVTTLRLDSLGRKVSRETTTGGSPITDYFAYDLLDNVVFTTDLFDATAVAYDAHGRAVGVKGLDGGRTTATHDAWGRPTEIANADSGEKLLSRSVLEYAAAGRLRSVNTTVDQAQSRVTSFAWDGASRTTGISSSGRAAKTRYDSASRLLGIEAGSGSALSVSTAFLSAEVSGHSGRLPQTAAAKEKSGAAYQLGLEYNTLGQITADRLGDLEWTTEFDQLGNMTAAQAPNRAARTFEYDSRGVLKRETIAGGGAKNYAYHPTGALVTFTDPANEVTETVNDLIGRPTRRVYKDGTDEEIVWEGRRVKSITDRKGRVQSFTYDAKGKISEIKSATGTLLDKITYDDAGRVTSWANDDAIIEFSDFDFEGHPRRTRQSRLRDGEVIDSYTQDHTWNVHGERTSWTMPSYEDFDSSNSWTESIQQSYDAAGNITRIERSLHAGVGGVFLDADYRNKGRPDRRTITTPALRTILREYEYNDANDLLKRMAVVANGVTVAGSEVEFDGLQRSRARLLGLSGGSRFNAWTYDVRSRLEGSLLGLDREAAPQSEELTAGDFRTNLRRTPSTPFDPPSIGFDEDPAGGHKIKLMRRGTVVEEFEFTGGERIEDGRFSYEYDAKGRLASVTQKTSGPIIRRVKYSYDGGGHLVGRRAEYANVTGTDPPEQDAWKLEDRADILASDALPAETTFVWDPITDVLVALFRTGASKNPDIDANGGLLRQIIHGGVGHDDPLEIATVDVASTSGVSRLYPIYDEAGASSLQLILNDDGQIVSRSVIAGPYGEDQAILAGPAVDRVQVTARNDDSGNLVSVEILMRSTERVAQSAVASGFRLATVNSDGTVAGTGGGVAALDGESTVTWRLTGSEWNALVSAGTALSIAATKDARGETWTSSATFLAAPAWAVSTKPVFTSAQLPVEVRESLAGLAQWLASIPPGGEKTNTLYEVPTLYALGVPRLETEVAFPAGDPQILIVASAFHAHPFQDPMTAKNFVRARWFDLRTGTWLTPDPSGYIDSSNLYAYAGGDPVNAIDPTGNCTDPRKAECRRYMWTFTKIFVPDFASGVAEVGANIITLGGYSGVKRAYERGDLTGSASVGEAYVLGLANAVTLGWYNTAIDTMEQGGSVSEATKTWALETSGHTGISEGAELAAEGKWLEGTGRFAEGVSSGLGLIIGARTSASRVRGQPVTPSGRNGAARSAPASTAAATPPAAAAGTRSGAGAPPAGGSGPRTGAGSPASGGGTGAAASGAPAPTVRYDPSVTRYRDIKTGRFVAGRNLPFPGNAGFASRSRAVLSPGTVIDRYGRPSGRYAGTPGASISDRGLPPGSEALEYHRYRVVREVPVDKGPAARVPEFGADGGAIQYLFDKPIEQLVRDGVLEIVKP
ncbi:MAG TPA: Ig-like domain-containing protein [Thermoanaerobaculia bacterium]|nr:Ig-like domain-containing protein [Thermoanaerobaculia bacterium]